MPNPLLAAVAATLAKYPTIDHWHVGFSGGKDSTALLHALHQLASCSAIHIDHGIQLNHWPQHCRSFCAQHNIPIHIETLSLPSDTREAKARKHRYQAFSKIVQPHQGLMLAHHAHDQAETIAQRLCMGSGLAGLRGMPQARMHADFQIVRPWLMLDPSHILTYLREHQLPYIDDPSNQALHHSRNAWRHKHLPYLTKHTQKSWHLILNQLGERATENQSLLNEIGEADLKQWQCHARALELTALDTLSDARMLNLMHTWLKKHQTPPLPRRQWQELVRQIKAAAPHKSPALQWGGFQLRVYRKRLASPQHRHSPSRSDAVCPIDSP